MEEKAAKSGSASCFGSCARSHTEPTEAPVAQHQEYDLSDVFNDVIKHQDTDQRLINVKHSLFSRCPPALPRNQARVYTPACIIPTGEQQQSVIRSHRNSGQIWEKVQRCRRSTSDKEATQTIGLGQEAQTTKAATETREPRFCRLG